MRRKKISHQPSCTNILLGAIPIGRRRSPSARGHIHAAEARAHHSDNAQEVGWLSVEYSPYCKPWSFTIEDPRAAKEHEANI